MYTRYLKEFKLPKIKFEEGWVFIQKRPSLNYYPFNILKGEKRLFEIFPITIFYGGNGSGKTTLLNLISEKLSLPRHSTFGGSRYFADYVGFCESNIAVAPDGSRMLSSDDVFDYLIDLRNVNKGVDLKREEVINQYHANKYKKARLENLDDFEEWRQIATTKYLNESNYIRRNMGCDNIEMHSNGQSAFSFFLKNINENALYLLDEPENSLSIEKQIELAKYIESSARYYNCQFILSTHSPVILSIRDAVIYDLDDEHKCKKWTELENVRKYYEFFREHSDEFNVCNETGN